MIPGTFQRVTIVRLRYPVIVDHGVERADYAATPTRLPIEGCWTEPIETQSVVDGRLAVLTGHTIAAPPRIDVRPADHIELAGVEYEIRGDVMPIPSPTGALDATKLNVFRWEG